MNYCKKCGTQLVDGAKFCQKCGCPTQGNHETYTQRQQEFVGKVYKCPYCGEILKSFEVKCPACGCELRGAKASSAVKEFALKLEAIESRREYKPPVRGSFWPSSAGEQISKTDEQKISLIKNFAVPNTAEDMLEFMILATSNVNMDIYNSCKSVTKSEESLSKAWASKIEQVYKKGRISHGDKKVFQQIQSLYDSFNLKAKKSKRKGIISISLLLGWWIPVLIISMITLLAISNVRAPDAARTEIARLEIIEQEASQALENGEYKRALLTAEGLEYNPSVKGDVEGLGSYEDISRRWDIERELLIDKIIEEAAKDGIILEQPADNSAEVEEQELPDGSGRSMQTIGEQKENADEISKEIDKLIEQLWVSTPSETLDASTPEAGATPDDVDYSTNVIEKGAVYTFGHDEFGLYLATAISGDIIQIEKWGKHFSTSRTFSPEYEVGVYYITDSENGFVWMDDNHTAFQFTLQDMRNGDYKEAKEIVFTISGIDGDINKGTNYNEDTVCFSHTGDDWHLYKAIPLTDTIMKIECWYRPMAIGSFNYGYDICVIDTDSNETDFKWTDSEHTSFTITLEDKENSDLKKGAIVAFTLE